MKSALLAVLLFAVALEATALPRLEAIDEARPNGIDVVRWRLSDLPDLPADEAVRPHLETGLTTSFVFRLSFRNRAGEKVQGGARVEIRYEIWDEVYHVRQLGIDGIATRRVLPSFDDLRAWWQELHLVVFEAPPLRLAGTGEVRLMVDLVPFSQREQDDAQRWFSDSLDRAGQSEAQEVTKSADEAPERLGRAFNLLMATSIQRRALESWQFQLAHPAEVTL